METLIKRELCPWGCGKEISPRGRGSHKRSCSACKPNGATEGLTEQSKIVARIHNRAEVAVADAQEAIARALLALDEPNAERVQNAKTNITMALKALAERENLLSILKGE